MAMGKARRIGRSAILVLAGLTVSAPSYAYLDPGTGSIILQSILASIAVAMGLLRLHWHRFKAFIGSLTGSSGAGSSAGEQDFARDPDSQKEA